MTSRLPLTPAAGPPPLAVAGAPLLARLSPPLAPPCRELTRFDRSHADRWIARGQQVETPAEPGMGHRTRPGFGGVNPHRSPRSFASRAAR